MNNGTQYGRLFPNDADGERNEFIEKFRSLMLNVNTSIPVKVTSVNSSGVSPVGLLDAEILTSQLTGNNQTVENAPLSNLPYMRYQGGKNAVIIDPQPGDIGIAIFAQRDISGVKNVRSYSAPSSRRTHDVSDGMYVGGILNQAPTQYILFNDDGISVYSPTVVNIEAPETNINSQTINLNGNVNISGNAQIDGDFNADGEATMGDNVNFGSHVHDETGSVTNGPRNP